MPGHGRFDISPFALPNCAPGEIRFEEPRDIREIEFEIEGPLPAGFGVSYLSKTWPRVRLERQSDLESPGIFGWNPLDDWFNCRRQKAAISFRRSGRSVFVAFKGLTAEYPKDAKDYDVDFRRTLGVRIEGVEPEKLGRIRIFTASRPAAASVRVELDAGKRTPGKRIGIFGYNARVTRIKAISGVRTAGHRIILGRGRRVFEADVQHMRPAHSYCHDAGHLSFAMDGDTFTVSLEDLARGGVWYREAGVFLSPAGSGLDFAGYRRKFQGRKTVNRRVRERPEHEYRSARSGQFRPHPVNYNLGCKHARQRFWLESNGDLVLHRHSLVNAPRNYANPAMTGADTGRFLASGNVRIFFGMEEWRCTARHPDPAPVPAYTISWEKNGILAKQESLCVPLMRSILKGEPAGDETTVALVRFNFRNAGAAPAVARLPIRYSQESNRNGGWLDAYEVPESPLDKLTVRGKRIEGAFEGKRILRLAFSGGMRPIQDKEGLALIRELGPGRSCEVVLKVPFIALDRKDELAALKRLDFARSRREITAFWRKECSSGSQLACPEQHFGDLYKSHLMHVQISDFAMPGRPEMINTSVGTSTYGNYSNESCMIVQELDQRGMHEDVERRLETWLRFQGTVPQPGNFTDYDGMFYGAGGFECGDYNQHHGWVLWCLAEHFRLTRNRAWLDRIAPALIKGADWVFRQRRNTLGPLPHSRGWEKGFLPAGSLEDVTDFHYWLSTNSLTWRGCDSAAQVLEETGHPQAARIRREADAYRDDLRAGFEQMRRHSPLVPLDDGRWVPTYPSRMYMRGRDTGWIREVLEGSVYLLISGLYDPDSKEGGWILDDYQDNRYLKPPYGYKLVDPERNLFSRGGFSIQPNLLAGLMPHLDRDEPEIYIWMFINAWISCYREEINGMAEHPLPELGFSNAAQFKTSDEANAIMWLRFMHVYWNRDLLHLGRALPRAWLKHGRKPAITGVATYFGRVGAHYESSAARRRIRLLADLDLDRTPGRILARFRHPEGKKLRAATVNGRRGRIADAVRGDVDLTGLHGRILVTAYF